MKAPPPPQLDELPPPPLLVSATRELSRFGWVWVVLGVAFGAVDLASGSSSELDRGELVAVLIFLGLSLACVLGALLLARRTGPEILYFRILDRAPPPPSGVPLESSGATTRRVIPPALAVAIGLLLAAVVGVGVSLVMSGQPRSGVREDLAGGALLVGAGWTLTCGAAGLRMATYFRHWERMREALVLCRPLKAGTMRPVYWVARADD